MMNLLIDFCITIHLFIIKIHWKNLVAHTFVLIQIFIYLFLNPFKNSFLTLNVLSWYWCTKVCRIHIDFACSTDVHLEMIWVQLDQSPLLKICSYGSIIYLNFFNSVRIPSYMTHSTSSSFCSYIWLGTLGKIHTLISLYHQN